MSSNPYGAHCPKIRIVVIDLEIGDYLRTRDGVAGVVESFHSERGNMIIALKNQRNPVTIASNAQVVVVNPTR